MKKFFLKNWFYFVLTFLAFLCWGRLLTLKGIWWDDWAWVWHYFGSANMPEFMLPWRSLRHEFIGLLTYLNFNTLFTFFPNQATNIWNILKFILFLFNTFLIYSITASLTRKSSILPEISAAIYLFSPIVNNLCLVMLPYHFFLSLFLFSLLATLRSLSGPRLNWFYYILAFILSALAMFGLESFVFMEMIRPLLIFQYYSQKSKDANLKNLKKTIFYWVPFLFFGFVVLLYASGILLPRFGIYASTYSPPVHISLAGYFLQILAAYKNAVLYFLGGNAAHFLKRIPGLPKDAFVFPALCALFAVILINISLKRKQDKTDIDSGDQRKAMLFGIIWFFIGLLPYALVRGAPGFGLHSRHALLANVGFSIFISALLLWLWAGKFIKKGIFFLALWSVLFLGAFECANTLRAYANDWQQQRNFWWAFFTRAPDIKEGALLIIDMPRSESEHFGDWRGDYCFGAPLNLFYAKSKSYKEMNANFADSLEDMFDPSNPWSYLNNSDRKEVSFDSYKGKCRYFPTNLIVASFRGGTLKLNEEIDKLGCSVDPAKLISRVAKTQIIYSGAPAFPLRWLIGPQPRRDWNYYLYKMKVAFINKNYKDIVALYGEAKNTGVLPVFPEVCPAFIIESINSYGSKDEAKELLNYREFSDIRR